MPIEIIEINDVHGKVQEPDWLRQAEAVHRQLRPQLPGDYLEKMQRVFAAGGRMSVAALERAVAGVAVYRIYENTALGLHMYVDDLVTDEARRSKGVGQALLDHLQTIAVNQSCGKVTLDSGTHRLQAHKFYFREGFLITSFHFHRPVKSRPESK